MSRLQLRTLFTFLALVALVATAKAAKPLDPVGDAAKNDAAVESSLRPAAPSGRVSAVPGARGVGGKRERNPRVLFITSKDCPKCNEELDRLRRAGGEFEKMRAHGWTIGAGADNLVQIVEREAIPELVEQLAVREYPTVACIDKGEVVRSFSSGCTTPLDAWTFGFLAKGVDERPPAAVLEEARVESTGSYRLRGNHWSVDGDWNPTKEKVIGHLRGPNHGSQILVSQHIESWSYEELRSLHDDLHEREGGGSFASSQSSRVPDQFSAARKIKGF